MTYKNEKIVTILKLEKNKKTLLTKKHYKTLDDHNFFFNLKTEMIKTYFSI